MNQLRFAAQGQTWAEGSDASTVVSKAAAVRVILTDSAGFSSSRTVSLAWPTEVTP